MRMSQRLALLSSSMTSHFKIPQTTKAVKKDDMAYTSASTAENQNESEKVYANEPTKPAPISSQVLSGVNSFSRVMPIILRPKRVMDQNKKRIVNALASTLIKLIQ